MGNRRRSRARRPDRMVRLRITLYLVLALSAHVNVSNSMIQERKPRRHEGEWSKTGVSHPGVDNKAGVSQPGVDSKAGVSHPEVNSKLMISPVEFDGNAGIPRPEVNRKASIPKQFQEVHSKAGVSQIIENMLRLDRHSEVLEQTGNMLNVKECPSDCQCVLLHMQGHPALSVKSCKYDPYDSLPKLFDSHRDITVLILQNCHLTLLPPEILKLSLIAVSLDMNEFTEIPQQLLELPQLAELSMEYNKLSHLPADLTPWSTLKVLYLGHNMISELPEGVGRMTNLQQVNLTQNELQPLTKGIGRLSQLLYLELSYNKVNYLPAGVGNLTKLKGLHLHKNQLKTLPCEIGGMMSMIDLQLQDNDIRIVPNDTTKLKQLASLNLTNNPLGEVPPLPTENLVQFICNNCSILTLPCRLFTKGHIEILDLSYNAIQTADCGQTVSNSIFEFFLANNSLQEVPCEYMFPNMRRIAFSYNNISTLPKWCQLHSGPYMEGIYFHYNKIDTLHFSSFCTEKSYGRLRLVGFVENRISTIDTSDSPLEQCFSPGAVIQLGGNRLSVLDSWPMLLSQHKSIKVYVRNNNLSQFTSSSGSHFHASQYGSAFSMEGNQIKHFMDVFNGWKVIVNTTEDLNTVMKNAYFDLGYNPLVCDCVDYEIYRYIQTLITDKYNNLVCHEPKSLRGQNPHRIPLGDFVCDVDGNCPDGCTCTKVPHSKAMNVTCLSYNETDIPDVLPNLPKQNYGYQLNICHQNVHEITFQPYLLKTTEIRLSNNSVTGIKINYSRAFRRVKILHIDNNHLQRLPESVAGMTNETVVEIRLGSNPWVCDCDAMTMKSWIMKNWHIVKDKDTIRCHSPWHMIGVKVMNIERSIVCPNESKIAVYVVAIISSAVFILIVCVCIHDSLKIANWRLVGSDECDGEFKEFDIFMCACSAEVDSDYVENFLIPELERRDFRVLYHREHFHPGKPIHVNMCEALEKCKRTLVFFSNSFRESGYSMYEFHSALDLDVQNRTKRLITIKDTNLDMRKLEISEVYYFRKHTYLDRRDVKFWTLLENVLPRKRLGAQVRR